MPNIKYVPELKKHIIRLHLEEGRTIKTLPKNIILVKIHYVTDYHSTAKNAKQMKKTKKKMMYMQK